VVVKFREGPDVVVLVAPPKFMVVLEVVVLGFPKFIVPVVVPEVLPVPIVKAEGVLVLAPLFGRAPLVVKLEGAVKPPKLGGLAAFC